VVLFLGAIGLGMGLHAILIPLEGLIPAIREHNLDPILRTIPPLVAGFLWSRRASQRTLWRAGMKGGVIGGISGLLGASLAAVLGAARPSGLVLAVSATGTGLLLGAGAAVMGKTGERERGIKG